MIYDKGTKSIIEIKINQLLYHMHLNIMPIYDSHVTIMWLNSLEHNENFT